MVCICATNVYYYTGLPLYYWHCVLFNSHISVNARQSFLLDCTARHLYYSLALCCLSNACYSSERPWHWLTSTGSDCTHTQTIASNYTRHTTVLGFCVVYWLLEYTVGSFSHSIPLDYIMRSNEILFIQGPGYLQCSCSMYSSVTVQRAAIGLPDTLHIGHSIIKTSFWTQCHMAGHAEVLWVLHYSA